MNKKEYKKPSMQMVQLKHKYQILVGSDNYGLNNELQDFEVEDGW